MLLFFKWYRPLLSFRFASPLSSLPDMTTELSLVFVAKSALYFVFFGIEILKSFWMRLDSRIPFWMMSLASPCGLFGSSSGMFACKVSSPLAYGFCPATTSRFLMFAFSISILIFFGTLSMRLKS